MLKNLCNTYSTFLMQLNSSIYLKVQEYFNKYHRGKMILKTFVDLTLLLLDLYSFQLFIFVVMSLLLSFKILNSSQILVYKIYEALFKLNEPILGKIRKFMPNLGGIDISPIALFIAIWFFKNLIFNIYYY